MLYNPERAKAMAEEALTRIATVFNWANIAKQTNDVYVRCWKEYVKSDW